MADTTRTVKAKFDGDTTGLARAARDGEREIDRFNKSVDKKFRKSGDDSGKSFFTGVRKWFTGKGADLGKEGGTVFGSGFLGALKTPILGPALVATLGAAVAVAAPAVGAIAGTGLVAGFGLGLAGLGLVFAAKSDRVKKVWKTDLTAMSDDLVLLSRPFEDTLVQMSGFARRTFDRFKPELGAAFRELAPEVTGLADEASKAFERLAPVIRPVADATSTVLRTLGPALSAALDQTSKGLVKLADSVKRNPDALADFVKGIGDVSGLLLGFLSTLNNINGEFEHLTGGTSAVDVVMKGLQVTLGPLVATFQGLNAGLGAFNRLTAPVGQGFVYTATTAQEAATATGYWTQGLTKAQLAAMGITGATQTAGAAAESLTTKYNRQKAATDALVQSTFRLQNQQLGLQGATINYQAAIDAATASVKANGRTLNDNTEKGRANHSALLQVAQAANAQTQALIESNAGLGAATRSAQSSRASFVRLATQMGLSKKEAQALADKLIGIPKDTKAKVSAPGAKGAKSDVDGLNSALSRVPSSKTVTITYKTNGIPRTFLPGSSTPGRSASGGPVQPMRSYLVGERGPELLTMGNQPGRITNAEKLRNGTAGEAAQPLVAEIHIEIGGEVVRVVKSEIKANDRDTTRRVTAGVRR